MEKDLLTKLEQLAAFPAVSGNEVALHNYLRTYLKHADKIWVDVRGNLIAKKGQAPKVAIVAHADKVGFMVSKYLGGNKFQVIQLKKDKIKPTKTSQQVVVSHFGETQPFTKGQLNKKCEFIRVKDPKEVKPGDFVAFAPNFEFEDGLIYSQGLDDRAGILVALEALVQAKSAYLVISAQEEMPEKPVSKAIWAIKPKQVIVVDVTVAEGDIKPGHGPTICLKDSLVHDFQMTSKLQQLARANNIPYQLEIIPEGGSDAVGVAAVPLPTRFCFIGIPLRDMHSSRELIYYDDLLNSMRLLKAYLGGQSG